MRVYKNHVAILNSDQFRYEIALKEDETISFYDALRVVASTSGLSWKELGEFLNVGNAAAAFRVVHGKWNSDVAKVREDLKLLFVLDDVGHAAYLYHHEHQPEGTIRPTPISPVIFNNEDAKKKVLQYIPTQMLGRLVVSYPGHEERRLHMTVAPKNGYIYIPGQPSGGRANAPLYFSANARRLTNILNDIRFVSNTTGSVELKVDVATTADYATAISTKVTATVQANPSAAAYEPKVTMPSSSAVTVGEISKFPDITVSEAQNRIMMVTIVPFSCDIHGLPGKLYPLKSGESWSVKGDADYINTQLHDLSVRAYDKTAQVAVNAVSGNAHDLKYYAFEYKEPAANTPSITVRQDTVSGQQGSEVALGVSFTGGEPDAQYSISLTPTNCTVKDLGKGSTISNKYPFKGTVDEINAELQNAKIVLGASSGRLDIEHPDGTKTITVTVTGAAAAAKVEPSSTEPTAEKSVKSKKQ